MKIVAASAACGLLAAGIQLLFPVSVERLRNIQYDLLIRARPAKPAVDDRLVLFGIDDRTIETLGHYPLPRNFHAELTRGLHEAKATLVAWDMIFDLPNQADILFAEAMTNMPTIMAVGTTEVRAGVAADADWLGGAAGEWRKSIKARILERFGISRLRAGRPEGLPDYAIRLVMNQQILHNLAGVGHASPLLDPDGVCRRIPLVIQVDDQLLPSLSLAMAMQILGVPHDDLQLIGTQHLRLGGRSLSDPVEIPIDRDGCMLVNYVTRWQDAYDRRSYAMQLKALKEFPEDMTEGLAGRAVLVGETQSAGGDFVPTPLQRSTPGMVVLAEAANTILTGQFITAAPPLACMLLAFAAALLTGVPFVSRKPGIFLLAALPVVVLPVLCVWLLYQKAYYLPVAIPFATVILTTGVMVSIRLFAEHHRASRTAALLGKFVSPSILHDLEEKEYRDEEVSVSRKELSVLFVDLVGFTQRTVNSEPEEMAQFLAAYYDVVLSAIHGQGGTLDKVMGDGALAYFGAPVPIEHKERCAVNAALTLAERTAELSDKLAGEGHAELAIRCGIATDYVTLGYLGGKRFACYTVLGRAVNLAARLEQNAKPGEILVDRHTAARLGDGFKTEELDSISLKGIDNPVGVLRVSRL